MEGDILRTPQAAPPVDDRRRDLEEVLPSVSVVMPVYNEAQWIERSLGAVFGQDYPRRLVEVLIAVRRSNDGTLDRIHQMMARHPDRRVRLLENPERTPGAALNRMVQEARGDIIVRVDGHAEVAPDYVRRCVSTLLSSDALNVGGCVTAAGRGLVGRTVAMALGSFWGNGGARYRSSPPARPIYVDTVQFGAWRRETLARLGPFVEWEVNEDCEFNARILDANGRILLHPSIRAVYFPRSSLGALARQYFRYGRLKCRVIALHPRRLRFRQVAPPILVIVLLSGFAVTTVGMMPIPFLFTAPLAYLGAIGLASARLAFRSGQPAFACVLPAVLATLHVSYGTGALLGIGQTVASVLRFRSHRERWRAKSSRTSLENGDPMLANVGDTQSLFRAPDPALPISPPD